MGRAAKNPVTVVTPITSKKQLMQIKAVCQFLGGISDDTLADIRKTDSRFPKPLQVIGGGPMWSVEQLEKFISHKEKEAEKLSA